MATPTVNDESLPLANEDQPFYDAVRAEFGDRCTEDFLIRVARAFRSQKKNRMQMTLSCAKRIMEWRDQYEADTVLERELDLSKIFFDCWPGMMYGEDNEGHVITLDRISEIRAEMFEREFKVVERLIPHRMQYMERIQWEKAAISTRLGRRVYKYIGIVDCRGLGMKHMRHQMLGNLKAIFDVGQLYYPETLHRLYLINAPMIFYAMWKIIGALIDPETREKIVVLKDGANFIEVAGQHGIPVESLPIYLGGKHPGRPLNNTFKPSVAGTPLPVVSPTPVTPTTPPVNTQ